MYAIVSRHLRRPLTRPLFPPCMRQQWYPYSNITHRYPSALHRQVQFHTLGSVEETEHHKSLLLYIDKYIYFTIVDWLGWWRFSNKAWTCVHKLPDVFLIFWETPKGNTQLYILWYWLRILLYHFKWYEASNCTRRQFNQWQHLSIWKNINHTLLHYTYMHLLKKLDLILSRTLVILEAIMYQMSLLLVCSNIFVILLNG